MSKQKQRSKNQGQKKKKDKNNLRMYKNTKIKKSRVLSKSYLT